MKLDVNPCWFQRNISCQIPFIVHFNGSKWKVSPASFAKNWPLFWQTIDSLCQIQFHFQKFIYYLRLSWIMGVSPPREVKKNLLLGFAKDDLWRLKVETKVRPLKSCWISQKKVPQFCGEKLRAIISPEHQDFCRFFSSRKKRFVFVLISISKGLNLSGKIPTNENREENQLKLRDKNLIYFCREKYDLPKKSKGISFSNFADF